MVKAAKFMVLVAGLMGLVAFFLPLFSVDVAGKSFTVSAFQAVRGVEAVKANLEKQAGEKMQNDPQAQKAVADLDDVLTKVKSYLFIMYAPAALLLLLGVIGVVKQKFGRGFGVLSLLLGLVTFGFWALLFFAAGEAKKEQAEATFGLGLGVHLLLGTGILGFLGGVTNTVKPDRD
ncbi:MAG TPA: hypothetical protein VFU21_20500 [Kofleriaceae bacterium]|nr:hypothetical protein [Kofleriaceae bacterium]